MLEAVFLDDGGVLNDNRRRSLRWRVLAGEFLAAHLGGPPDAWSAANQEVFPPLWRDLQARLPTFSGHADFQATYDRRWMQEMCAAVGIAPPSDAACLRLARDCAIFVAMRCDAAVEGAVAVVQQLHAAGLRIHMASGTASWELDAILQRMGLRAQVRTLCGPDLLGPLKASPAYYSALLAHTGEDPARAVVIESDLEACGWAQAVGLQARWCDVASPEAPTLAEIAAQLVEGRLR